MTFRNNSSPPVLEMKQNRFSSPTLTPIFLQWKCCDGFLCQWFHAEIPGYVWWRKIPRTYLFVPFLKVNNPPPKPRPENPPNQYSWAWLRGKFCLASRSSGSSDLQGSTGQTHGNSHGRPRWHSPGPEFLLLLAIWTTCGEAVKLGENLP